MKMSISGIDEQIREVENRIALERLALDDAIEGCANSLRDALTSPKTLLALLGVGYGLGKIMFSGKAAPQPAPAPVKTGVLGLLTGMAGTALSLMQPRFGLGSVVRWAASKALAGGAGSSPRRTPAGVS